MVIICKNNNYPQENNKIYREHFDKYLYPLSDFQKHAVEGIVNGCHSLVCAPTGSGKTLCAEFAIEYFVSQGKRVIYTSPLKALSNEKFYDFTAKFPHISFGIITGDIKANPEAQVLIMTAEILLNQLFSVYNPKTDDNSNSSVSGETKMFHSFEMDFENELTCVIMDEIHFINDALRGGVWEQTLMILPKHVQLVMLSATLDSPEKFAMWIENIIPLENKQIENQGEDSLISSFNKFKKEVYLAYTDHRIVPLIHYSFITTNQGLFKQIKKDEVLTKEIKDLINKPFILQSSKNQFNEVQYFKMKKALTLFEQKNIFIKKQHIINELLKYMVQNEMFPAVLFILSRKQIEIMSKEITIPLLEDDSKVPYIIHKEAEQILRKLPNYKEYLNLPEYKELICLLQKGIAIHHSGIIPVLREIVEILFSKGYIKLLLATETFSTGLNMPIKTTIFTSLSKFDGNENRPLYSHEYTQMAGRAGRRNIDTIGHVIHLNNLFKNLELTHYKTIMHNKPQRLVSKFKISYNLLLNLINYGDKSILEFVNKSMIYDDISLNLSSIQKEIDSEEKLLTNSNEVLLNMKTPKEDVDNYIYLLESIKKAVNKKKKDIEKSLCDLKDSHKTLEQDKTIVLRNNEIKNKLISLRENYDKTSQFLNSNILKIVDFLIAENFIYKENNELKVCLKGFIACNLREVHCLCLAELINSNVLDDLSAKQLICIFSCFTNVNVSDENKCFKLNNTDNNIKRVIETIKSSFDKYQDFESKNGLNTGVDYTFHYDLVNYVSEWCECNNSEECILLLKKIEVEKEIFLGEFVKAVLKINNISSEIEKVAESIGNMKLLNVLREVGSLTLKFVITNQSLYV